VKNVLILCLLATNICHSQCSVSGPNSGSSFANNAAVGSVAWNNLSNAQVSNNSYATGNVSIGILSSATTNYLVITGFGFAIPGGASICGIRIEVEKRYNLLIGLLSSISDNNVRIVKGGTITGSNRALGGGWPSSDTY
jgi:hypothetical protein